MLVRTGDNEIEGGSSIIALGIIIFNGVRISNTGEGCDAVFENTLTATTFSTEGLILPII
jgi:hypothetical protein